jgi:hypothetical protein
MFTLIRREIEDTIVLFLVAVIFAAITVSVLVSNTYDPRGGFSGSPVGVPSIMYGSLVIFPFVSSLWLAAGFGAAQMHQDKNKKISAFLATLGTTRGRIFAARVITGVLFLGIMFLPVVVTDVVLLKVFPRAVVTDAGFLRDIFIVAFLGGLACYGFGLQIGWSSNKVVPALGVLFFGAVLLSLVFIKGFGIESMVILSLFAVAAIVRAGQKFMSASF